MSIYRCGICEEYKDADLHGCCEWKESEYDNICEDCEMNLEEDKKVET